MSTARYVVDVHDPRAPTEAEWAALSPGERDTVVAALPALIPPAEFAPEGDPHRKAKRGAEDALDGFFRRIGRKVYISSDLNVYYPDEPRFAPDVLAVLDVEPYERMKWVVATEGKGLDLVLEVHVAGDYAKDAEANVARYARLGIAEYFLFDRARLRLRGYRLGPRGKTYEAIVPQLGRFESRVLGLDLRIEGDGLRFYHGEAALPEADELIARLGGMLTASIQRREEVERERDDALQRVLEERAAREVAERELAELRKLLEKRRR